MPVFFNRTIEQKVIKSNIENGIRVHIIYSTKGMGKSELISYTLEDKSQNNAYYINVCTEELLTKDFAEDYYFFKAIIDKINDQFPGTEIQNFYSKTSNNAIETSFSLNAFIFGISFSIPRNYAFLQSSIIRFLKKQKNNIYLHIENMQKIDRPSLRFLSRLINQTSNIYLFLEYSIANDLDVIEDSLSVFQRLNISPSCMEIAKLEWNYVCNILHNINVNVNSNIKREYFDLNGNLKTLLLRHRQQIAPDIQLSDDEIFLLSFIELVNSEFCIREIYEIINSYQNMNTYHSLLHLKKIEDSLFSKNLLLYSKNETLCISEYGTYFVKTKYQIIST